MSETKFGYRGFGHEHIPLSNILQRCADIFEGKHDEVAGEREDLVIELRARTTKQQTEEMLTEAAERARGEIP